jgi:ribosomal protein S18 acetylase RimI-like enzyme
LTEAGSTLLVRSLTADDEPALATFTCENYREPWTVVVQEVIREHLADNLAIDAVESVGAWLGGRLVGVAAWYHEARLTGVPAGRYSGPLCKSVVLAVETGFRRRGIGRRLKQEVLAAARQAGSDAVVSTVHWENEAMIELNVALGGNVERIVGDNDYCLCIIPLLHGRAPEKGRPT